MTGVSRGLLVLAVAVAAALLLGVRGRAQNRSDKPPREKVSLWYVEQKARAVRADDPKSVRALTDEIFDRSSFYNAPESIRARVFRSELAYRQGASAPVSEATFVEALNEQARPLAVLPNARISNIRTTVGQVHQFRQIMKQFVPNLSRGGQDEEPSGRVETTMSPSEVAFVAMHLVTQKIANPDFQEAPEEWEAKVAARRAAAATSDVQHDVGQKGQLTFAQREFATASDVMSSMRVQLKDESSVLVRGVHAFLDHVNVQR